MNNRFQALCWARSCLSHFPVGLGVPGTAAYALQVQQALARASWMLVASPEQEKLLSTSACSRHSYESLKLWGLMAH